MRTTRSDLDRVQRIAVGRWTRSRSEASPTSLQGGASVEVRKLCLIMFSLIFVFE